LVCPPPLWGQTNTLSRDSGLAPRDTTSKAVVPVVAAGRPQGGRERRVGRWGLGWSGSRISTGRYLPYRYSVSYTFDGRL